jgi:DNA sulfur modification protein DndD
VLLTSLTLHNFGAYRGRNAIDLTPPSPEKPIVLFGGLNGAGKTTILDALQLVLYGRRARCSGRGSLGYPEFLKRCINRTVPEREGAGLELQFTATHSEQSRQFHVHRSWDASGSGRIRERLTVMGEGLDTTFLSERWDEIVEEMLPLDISSLFFFDGEKIEALADPERAGKVIGTAIETLLGVNLLDRLGSDLIALEKRTKADAASDADRAVIDGLEAIAATARDRRAEAAQEVGARMNELDRTKLEAEAARTEFKRNGGDLFTERQRMEDELRELNRSRAETIEEMVELASGSLPLVVVKDLLQRTGDQLGAEENSQRARLIVCELETRDRDLLTAFGESVGPTIGSEMTDYLTADRTRRADAAQIEEYLPCADGLRERVNHHLSDGLRASSQSAAKSIERFQSVSSAREELERKLAAVPSGDAIAASARACAAADEAVTEARIKADFATELLDERSREAALAEKDLEDAYLRIGEQVASAEEATRIVTHANRVRETLAVFRERLMEKHLHGIEAAILDSLRKLLRKRSLVHDVRIDPETYSIDLFDSESRLIPTERLSAGERQLLAISLLWGLARVSGKALPTAIDTPLGRLDGTHRTLLAERYFPFASHQVLLLSTDREITSGVLDALQPFIGRSFALVHDDQEGCTSVVSGYFDREVSSVA